jgi:hypothetical protein
MILSAKVSPAWSRWDQSRHSALAASRADFQRSLLAARTNLWANTFSCAQSSSTTVTFSILSNLAGCWFLEDLEQ